MADRPRLFLTNLSSRRLHGPGRLLHIQAAPPRFVRDACKGSVPILAPARTDFDALQAGRIEPEEYRRRFVAGLVDRDLKPGNLEAVRGEGSVVTLWPVADGDTLVCTCARDQAAAGWCHRVWSAPALVAAGWDVLLDGVRFEVAGA